MMKFYNAFRKPTISGSLLADYKPIRENEVNFLDVTNDGLVIGISPNRRSNRFLSKIFAEAMQSRG